MKTLIATIFVAGLSLAAQAPAQAMSAAPLAQVVTDSSDIVRVAKACKRGYQLTPNGCRKIKSR